MNTGKLGCWTVSSSSCVVATSREHCSYSLILFGSDINKSSHHVSAERGSRRISTCASTWISLHSCGLSWQPTAVPFPGTLGQAFHLWLARPGDELQCTPMASLICTKQPCCGLLCPGDSLVFIFPLATMLTFTSAVGKLNVRVLWHHHMLLQVIS